MSASILPAVPLGTGGPWVGAQGLGCMGFSEFYGPTAPAQARETLRTALALGVTMFDTADLYGDGDNERFLGPFVRAHRDRVLIATKFGIVRRAGEKSWSQVRGDRAYIRQSAEASLKRLGVDEIDLYYAHRRDTSVPIEETVGAMAELVQEGKVRHLGLSEVTAPELHAAHSVHPIAALQSEWSLFTRDVETSVIPAAAQLGVALIAYAPLGRGLLTGTLAGAQRPNTDDPGTALPRLSTSDAGPPMPQPTGAQRLSTDDIRLTMPRFTGAHADANAALLDPVHDIAARRDLTPAQVALAWLHHRSRVHNLTVIPIPGTRSPTRLRQNLAAATLTLSDNDLTALEPLAAKVSGPRYPDMTTTSTARE
ncbi:aldo/keto reductase [Sphaerisporangium corydalis]|uniref:Aldo/keto reductase n=1 Tax=Sphaerisporangium corydalis TaxID=1441875 RepID=A0ABV9EUB4_9ACTN|nr:aldo/keto reductase [Sphaerisporangium corydalis]